MHESNRAPSMSTDSLCPCWNLVQEKYTSVRVAGQTFLEWLFTLCNNMFPCPPQRIIFSYLLGKLHTLQFSLFNWFPKRISYSSTKDNSPPNFVRNSKEFQSKTTDPICCYAREIICLYIQIWLECSFNTLSLISFWTSHCTNSPLRVQSLHTTTLS